MPRYEKTATRQRGGQSRNGNAGGVNSYNHRSTSGAESQAPSGALPAYVKDGLIYVAGRHLCSVRGGVLRRTFDARRELLKGGLAFRVDVLTLARENGARAIVATEKRSGLNYTIGLDVFGRHAWTYSHAKYGKQLCCGLEHWRRSDQEHAEEQADRQPRQLSLLEGLHV